LVSDPACSSPAWLPGAIVVQNRSHFVNEATHAQFKALPQWLAAHAHELYPILEPGRILYGEWLYARHTVAYSRLPDYFLAFDVYDRSRGVFLSRRARDALLADTTLATVPLLYEGPLRGPAAAADLLPRLQRAESRFAAGPVEGLYLRVDDAATETLAVRAKVVRADFAQAITSHWAGRVLERNTLAI
jgi:atypical dual specificity phosphatase